MLILHNYKPSSVPFKKTSYNYRIVGDSHYARKGIVELTVQGVTFLS
jgi:hypothetical protein